MSISKIFKFAILAVCCAAAVATVSAQESKPVDKAVNVPAGDLAAALQLLSKQSGIELVFRPEQLRGLRTRGVQGTLSSHEAVTRLLEGTPLTFHADSSGILLISSPQTAPGDSRQSGNVSQQQWQMAQAEDGDTPQQADKAQRPAADEMSKGVPEILVEGSRILNMDIRRSRDDAQPYVIFERDTIEHSGAANLEDFLKQRLTMNSQGQTFNVSAPNGGTLNLSQVNLRGLGTSQTLILVDGHRTASPISTNGPQQADLNAIPIAAVERIEILPTTASGIYGGGATGGVVNIVLRRDYSGVQTKLTYDDSFGGGAVARRIDVNGGFSLEDGKTSVLLAGSYLDGNGLSLRDRDFYQRGTDALLTNNPSFILNLATPRLGATPNIRSASGAPLFGAGSANITSVPQGYAGGGGLAPLQTSAGRYNYGLAESAQGPGGAGSPLLNASRTESFMATLRRQFSSTVQAFLDVSATNNTGRSTSGVSGTTFTVNGTAPNNPFNQNIRVTLPVSAGDGEVITTRYDRRLVGGVILKLPGEWQSGLDYTWNRSRTAYGFPTFSLNTAALSPLIATGALDVLRDLTAYPLNLSPYVQAPTFSSPRYSTLKNASARIAGPIVNLPGGAVTVSGLLEHRDENIGEGYEYAPASTSYRPDRSQAVNSAYLEFKLPLISARNAVPAVQSLELQIAGRWDEYRTDGVTNVITVGSTAPVARARNSVTSTDPTFGLRWQIVSDLTLRASYGTGFLPPTVQQLVGTTPFPTSGAAQLVTDPRRGNQTLGNFTLLGGGNAALQPETSESTSAGVILTPRFIPGLRVSVDWMRIEKQENIVSLSFIQDYINNETLLAGRIVRDVAAPGDPFGVGAITTIDSSLANIARAEVEAYDVAIDYTRDTARLGSFDVFTQATWQTHYKTQLIPSAPVVENAGIGSAGGLTAVGPLKFKANGGVVWNYRQWTAGWTARFFGAYRVSTAPLVILNQGADGTVASQIYHDIFTRYRWNSGAAGDSLVGQLLRGTEVQLGIRNVFDRQPPFDAGSSTAFYSSFGDPRLSSYYLSFSKDFR